MHTQSRFLLLGEPLALDLVNTRIRRNGAEVDLLDSTAALAAWLRAEHGRIAWTGKVTSADLGAVRALRDAIDGLLRAHRAHARPQREALARLNCAQAPGRAHSRVTWTAAGPVLKPPPRGARRHALLRELAADAMVLLVGPRAGRVRECTHPDCRLQFLALNPRRLWCSSATCGNRARVAQHYRRHQRAG